MRRMLDQTMAWIVGVTASTAVTGGIAYGLKKIHVNEFASHDSHEKSEHATSSHGESDSEHPTENAPDHSTKVEESHVPEEPAHKNTEDGEHSDSEGAKEPADDHSSHSAPESSTEHASTGEHKAWKYSGDLGPDKWGELAADFEKCQGGNQQSPINFQTVTPSDRDMPVEFHYRDMSLSWGFNGHTLQADLSSGSYINFEKKRYQLIQFHFHTPSEHTVHGEAYPAELHLVHKDSTGKLAVIGLLIKAGDENDALQDLVEKLPRTPGKTAKISGFSPDRILPAQGFYYSYRGSLTTPPCSEEVRWIVMKQPIEMSSRQLASLSNIMGSNARPVQALNGRKPRLEGIEFTSH